MHHAPCTMYCILGDLRPALIADYFDCDTCANTKRRWRYAAESSHTLAITLMQTVLRSKAPAPLPLPLLHPS